jgi:hypothetical protein
MKKLLLVFGLLLLLTGCSKTYDNGDEYEGKMNLFFQPHGQGTLIYNDGDVFVGNFEKGEILGDGVLTSKSGVIRDGYFEGKELKNGTISFIVDYVEVEIEVDEFEMQMDENQNFFVVEEHDDISYALAKAMVTGKTVIVYSKNFDFDLRTMKKSDYGIVPYFDLATNYAINNFGIYNPSFSDPIITSSKEFPFIKAITVDFSLAKVQREQITDEVKRIAAEVVTEEMNDFEKVLAIHDYLKEHITYNEDLDNLTDIDHTAYGALIHGVAVCDGYMDAFHLVLNEVGIESHNVTGDDLDQTDNWWHAWSLVKMDGEYYHIDLTWNDTDDDRANYEFFGLTDDEIKETHIIFEANQIPEATGEKNNYYQYHLDRGIGITYYYNNATYYGTMNTDMEEHGYGKLYFFDGTKYFGSFYNGVKTNGTLYYKNGHRFEGKFKNGNIDNGVYYFDNGDRFEGQMTSSGFGYGTYYWSNGQSKTADFSQ